MDPAKVGLCSRCRHQRLIESGRGSRFSMCELGLQDPDWPKYPRLPVVACGRFEERGTAVAPVGPRG